MKMLYKNNLSNINLDQVTSYIAQRSKQDNKQNLEFYQKVEQERKSQRYKDNQKILNKEKRNSQLITETNQTAKTNRDHSTHSNKGIEKQFIQNNIGQDYKSPSQQIFNSKVNKIHSDFQQIIQKKAINLNTPRVVYNINQRKVDPYIQNESISPNNTLRYNQYRDAKKAVLQPLELNNISYVKNKEIDNTSKERNLSRLVDKSYINQIMNNSQIQMGLGFRKDNIKQELVRAPRIKSQYEQTDRNFFQKLEKSLNSKNHETFKNDEIHRACQSGDLKSLKKIIKNNINVQNKELNTPLHIACLYNQTDIVKFLSDYNNIDIDIINNKGQKAIQLTNSSKIIQIIKNKKKKLNINDFYINGMLGRGSFGEVYLVSYNNQQYAMKILEKSKIFKKKLNKYVTRERDVLVQTQHPFIIKLHHAFQTQNKLYLIMQYAQNGDLSKLLHKQQKLTENQAKIYLCQIILALEYLHQRDIIYRDLKPENIVIDQDGNCLLADFGLVKEGVLNHLQGGQSFCGSIAYLAPEIIQKGSHGKAVDWYTLGIVFYEILTGKPPYFQQNMYEIFNSIKKGQINIPNYISDNAKNLIKRLLQVNPDLRIGSKYDAQEIKNHSFFSDINWNDVQNKKYKINFDFPPIKIIKNYPEYDDDIQISEDQQYIQNWSFNLEN